MLAGVVNVKLKVVIIRKATMTEVAAQAVGADISSVQGD